MNCYTTLKKWTRRAPVFQFSSFRWPTSLHTALLRAIKILHSWHKQYLQAGPRKVNRRLPAKGNSNYHRARPVHQIISMITWIRTSTFSIKNSLSLQAGPDGQQSSAARSPEALHTFCGMLLAFRGVIIHFAGHHHNPRHFKDCYTFRGLLQQPSKCVQGFWGSA